ncbi:MAG: bifunctional UDP-N-acetylglucosamine diphosphorylase/glucosamine-1-phosphate N-acetyltransferase GlmU [Campylobacterota bacterium]|nr:bifunctional UDP-N-acetylglucosamine diphosphorylase/glucosamine-1-phosphate N-acetyltransferase GlmU [Campylobacterota bacterium]
MSKTLSIIILAAGKGSRMKSSTAKVLHPISGRPMLYHIIKASQELSDDITVVVAHQKEAVTKAMQSHFNNISFVTQDADNFPGTGGAVMNISPRYEQVLVLNGDMPLITTESMGGFLKSSADITMSIFDLEDPSGYGRVVISDVGVERIVEEKDASEAEKKITHVNAGVYAFKRNILERYLPKLSNDNAQGEYYLTDVVALAKADGLTIEPLLVGEEYFKGVNSKADLAASEEIMQRRIRAKWMQAGITMQLPETIYIEESVTFEGECLVENGCRICGETLVSDSHIKAHTIIEESIIKTSDIGPLAHIRPHSHLESTHIGNYVEVKKSTLNGVKAGHLSYIGDAEIDTGTNLGAGFITCNYDGKKKYKTIIGKNVFVGSDSHLIAPVVIEDDVIIAAGTTVATAKVEKGSLALSRTPMKTVKNFFYKFFGKDS